MARVISTGGCTLLLLSTLHAQSVAPRLHGTSGESAPAPVAQSVPAPAPPSTLVATETAPSLLQQPARDARIVFNDNSLSIRADNSSLTAILRQVASSSGMKIEGLGSDERVFGTFGPGAPRDVLADLLDGTAYNLVLLGDLSNGAPRELILTPATRGGAAAPAAVPQANPDDAVNDQESAEVPPPPPPPDIQQPGTTATPPTPGVRTPQQLFEQLQHMRQGQQQQQQPVQQDSPQQ